MIRQEVSEATSWFITSFEADVDKQKQEQKYRERESKREVAGKEVEADRASGRQDKAGCR